MLHLHTTPRDRSFAPVVTGLRTRILALALPLMLLAYEARAMGAGMPSTATVSAGGAAYYATSKSGLVESNDTGMLTTYGLNVFAGQTKSLSVHLEGSSAAFAYELNDTKLSTSDLTFSVRVHFSHFFIGGFAGTLEATAERADGESFEAYATLYGANFGAGLALSRGFWIGLDGRYAMPTDIKEADKQDVTLGAKTEGRVFFSYDLTRKLFDLQAGFLYGIQDASFLGTGDGETITAPFLGILMNSDF